jgi:hypothetical protein
MSVVMCGAQYTRPDGCVVSCSYVSGHSHQGQATAHSWRTLRLEDEQERARPGAYDSQVAVLLESIARGDVDYYLEAILAGCHERKRVKRGIWTPGGPR